MSNHEIELQIGRDRLQSLRARCAEQLRRAHRLGWRQLSGLRPLVLGVRRSLRWAAFKVEMLAIAGSRLQLAREELDVVLAAAEDHHRSLQRWLQRRAAEGARE